jgi:hypothetical protein
MLTNLMSCFFPKDAASLIDIRLRDSFKLQVGSSSKPPTEWHVQVCASLVLSDRQTLVIQCTTSVIQGVCGQTGSDAVPRGTKLCLADVCCAVLCCVMLCPAGPWHYAVWSR